MLCSECVPVQINKDDALRVIYQALQLSGFVSQLLGLHAEVITQSE